MFSGEIVQAHQFLANFSYHISGRKSAMDACHTGLPAREMKRNINFLSYCAEGIPILCLFVSLCHLYIADLLISDRWFFNFPIYWWLMFVISSFTYVAGYLPKTNCFCCMVLSPMVLPPVTLVKSYFFNPRYTFK